MDGKKRGDSFKIGDLASLFGLTPRTIRYYEEMGLLRSDDRTEGLHRRYPARAVVSLKRIMQLKSHGLSLGEIKEFFDLAEADPSGERCRALLLNKYEERIGAEEAAIQEARRRVGALRKEVSQLALAPRFFSCPGDDCPDCGLGDSCGEEGQEGLGTVAAEPGISSEPDSAADSGSQESSLW